jgi:hypothetical protein
MGLLSYSVLNYSYGFNLILKSELMLIYFLLIFNRSSPKTPILIFISFNNLNKCDS